MTKIETYTIKGHDDFELNIPRNQLLTYHLTYDDKKEPEGIIFIIPGFGGDSLISYQKHLIKYITEKYNLLAIFVEYHGLFARPSEDKECAIPKFGANDTEILIEYIDKLGINLDENNLEFHHIVSQIDQRVQELKSQNQLDSDFKLDMWGTLCPYKNEYQNFGVLQAIDILTVLYHVKSLGYENLINKKNIIALGSSHGGYIANLVMKFAPNTFDFIIDNSCYSKPPLQYIIGFEVNPHACEYSIFYPNIKMHYFTLTNWTTKKNSHEFTQSSYDIRDLSNPNQISQLAIQGNKTNVISYHSKFDEISNFDDKNDYIKELEKNDYTCKLNTINSKEQIDGLLIKHIDHAMGMSIKALVDTELPGILKITSSKETDLCLNSIIKYDVSNNCRFVFTFEQENITAKLYHTTCV